MNRIYLDYAATTPVDPRVFRAMQPYFSDAFGNPSSLHYFGQRALAALDASREAVAGALGASFREIIFTGSATEANNLAIKGNFLEFKKLNPGVKKPRLIISSIEHESVFEAAQDIEREGAEIIRLPVDRHGIVDAERLAKELNHRTFLVSIIYANNEIGTIQPIAKIGKIVRNFREELKTRNNEFKATPIIRNSSFMYPLFHTDAAQAFQFLDCVPSELGLNLMTLSTHKMYGPKGIGALYLRQPLVAMIAGGGQEFGMRSGTENVPFAVGFAKAAELACLERDRERTRLGKLRNYFWEKLKEIAPRAELTVPCAHDHPEYLGEEGFLPNILNVYFPGTSAEHLVTKLDILGVAVSSGSACHTRALRASRVIQALGFSKERAGQSIRFSFGRPTAKTHIEAALKKIKRAFK